VEVSVHIKGGVLGLDRVVRIDDTNVTVVEDGSKTRQARIPREDAQRLADIATRAARVAESRYRSSDPDAADASVTVIEIRDGGVQRHVHLSSGVPAPDEIWDLLDAVEQASQA
jgi:hypothetical protein